MFVVGAPSAGAATDTAATYRHAARALLLVGTDLPAGWKGTVAPPTTAQDRQDNRDIAACTGASNPDREYASEDSPNFDKGDSEAGSSATIVRTDADYAKDAAAIRGPKVIPCLRQALTREAIRAGYVLKQLAVTRFAVEPHGTLSGGIRVVETVTVDNEDVVVYIDFVFYGKTRREVSIVFTNVGAPFDPALAKAVTSRVGKRLDNSKP